MENETDFSCSGGFLKVVPLGDKVGETSLKGHEGQLTQQKTHPKPKHGNKKHGCEEGSIGKDLIETPHAIFWEIS